MSTLRNVIFTQNVCHVITTDLKQLHNKIHIQPEKFWSK